MRKCPNWLDTFMKWTLPRSEAQESYIKWTGLFTLSSVLRRKVKIPKNILGSWECPPHLYIMFIAPPGEARKTTSMSYAIDLLENLDDITKAPAIATQASLLSRLVDSKDNSVYITSEEFSDLIMKSKGEMFEFLTSMFDGKRSIEASTISRGAEFVNRPCINMLAATTPIWIAENMSEAVIGGGFASRVIFVYEESTRRKQLIYKNKIDFSHLDSLRANLIKDLIYINEKIEGDFDIDDEVIDFLESWYQTRKTEPNKKLKGYHERKPAHLLKTAMLLHIAHSDTLVLNKSDIDNAFEELSKLEVKLPKVFAGIGKNPYTFDMRDIVEFVVTIGRVEKIELLKHFEAAAPPSMLNELISALITMKQIKVEVDPISNKIYYCSK